MMRNMVWSAVILGVLGTAAGAVRAADTPGEATGLQPGKDQVGGSFLPYNVTGKDRHRGKFHSLVSEYGLDPVVLVFVRGNEPGPGTMDLLTKLDALVEKSERIRLHAFVVFLSDTLKDLVGKEKKDDDKREEEATTLLDKVGKLNHIAAALDVMADVRDSYKLDEKSEVTVIYYNKYRVELVRSYNPKTLDEAAVDALLKDINAKLEPLRAATARRRR
jgi:hypothetical protein